MSNKYQLWAGEYDMCMHVFQQSVCVCQTRPLRKHLKLLLTSKILFINLMALPRIVSEPHTALWGCCWMSEGRGYNYKSFLSSHKCCLYKANQLKLCPVEVIIAVGHNHHVTGRSNLAKGRKINMQAQRTIQAICLPGALGHFLVSWLFCSAMNMKMTWYSTVASSDKLSEFRHETHTLSTGNDKTRQAMQCLL